MCDVFGYQRGSRAYAQCATEAEKAQWREARSARARVNCGLRTPDWSSNTPRRCDGLQSRFSLAEEALADNQGDQQQCRL